MFAFSLRLSNSELVMILDTCKFRRWSAYAPQLVEHNTAYIWIKRISAGETVQILIEQVDASALLEARYLMPVDYAMHHKSNLMIRT